MRLVAATLLTLCFAAAKADYVNWENHPVHPLALSPDGTMLAVVHTQDRRLIWFDVTTGHPVRAGEVTVGLDPVAVAFESDQRAWVVNHISDSVSIVDLASRRVVATLATDDEPADVVFAGNPRRAFVSCSQANSVLSWRLDDLDAGPERIAIDAEEPRSLAVSPDGSRVYAAIFESGNGTTILAGGTAREPYPPNVVLNPETPWGGVYPPPNSADGFSPPLAGAREDVPPGGLIVRRDDQGRWMDDNGGDWTPWVSGENASESGRVPGWDTADRDIAVIDADRLSVSYVRRLMNIAMAVSVRPDDGVITLVGTDAINETRFEPVINGRFVKVLLASVDPGGGSTSVRDLNPHLDDAGASAGSSLRHQSVGDPRAIVWTADGGTAFVSGMGSNSVIAVARAGARAGDPITVGAGPVGLALDEARRRLYSWNHFDSSLSVIDLDRRVELERLALFTPEPPEIKRGRRELYDTHHGSGTGHLACASCHVDARTDRLAWDLGDPTGSTIAFEQNCATDRSGPPCEDFHAVKGPMMTQTLQDIIGHEPFHWRGDREGIEGFAPTFTNLQGRETEISSASMARLKAYLATIALPPNPHRQKDNALPRDLPLPDFVSSGRFSAQGTPLPPGDALEGMSRFRGGRLALLRTIEVQDDCATCHALPTGMGVNGPVHAFDGQTLLGGATLPAGPGANNHLGIVSIGNVTGRTFKIPQLRTLYEKLGFDTGATVSRAGFGFLHDGSVDTLVRFLSLQEFGVASDQDIADLAAFLLSFSGSDLPTSSVHHSVEPPTSRDSHAGVGWQKTLRAGEPATAVQDLLALADHPAVSVLVEGREATGRRAGIYDPATGEIRTDDGRSSLAAFRAGLEYVHFTVIPAQTATRLAFDRDRDGVTDRAELRQGSSPADPLASTPAPALGLWFNPARAGHGFDLQRLGEMLILTWYTYADDASPTWYQAVGPLAGGTWSAPLNRYLRRADGSLEEVSSGEVSLTFSDAKTARFDWRLGERSGSEPVQRYVFDTGLNVRDQVGVWYDPLDSGWGITLDTQGATRVAIAYFYDGEGLPRWSLGAGPTGAQQTIALDAFIGFCPDCDLVAIQPIDTGTLFFERSARREARIDLDTAAGGGRWQRGGAEIVPLGDPAIDLSGY